MYRRFLESIPDKSVILDVGCGNGKLFIKKFGVNCLGACLAKMNNHQLIKDK
jgi:hypothetical protein